LPKIVDPKLSYHLSLWPGDENPGTNPELKVSKPSTACDVLKWDALHALFEGKQ
jgi:hypothetical protein